jgi:hypothetical protein
VCHPSAQFLTCTAPRSKPVPSRTALPAVRLPMEYVSVLLTKRYSGDEIEKDETDGTCGMYWREKRCIKDCGGKGGPG